MLWKRICPCRHPAQCSSPFRCKQPLCRVPPAATTRTTERHLRHPTLHGPPVPPGVVVALDNVHAGAHGRSGAICFDVGNCGWKAMRREKVVLVAEPWRSCAGRQRIAVSAQGDGHFNGRLDVAVARHGDILRLPLSLENTSTVLFVMGNAWGWESVWQWRHGRERMTWCPRGSDERKERIDVTAGA
ncbi:uncharacterized protein B0I36DRAFT_125281 [Microdochium trichocladiopsis]|uniref:Uncharacterized protein n=1 Tax=Microdochium trichocladiopsis TaxID=1682393 RepID=A0A9P8Y9X5_9PEZI|nr:uncharacterized protein B0I36DRAFT_125281 [Microdochium trichocladiopsis]KAH7031641.1 hypothetical protein B0I36DRAFT_125281 [Microdochium trichocladiopsis]